MPGPPRIGIAGIGWIDKGIKPHSGDDVKLTIHLRRTISRCAGRLALHLEEVPHQCLIETDVDGLVFEAEGV